MFELKSISREGIQRALDKAERYRLLNEPEEAESICLDILQVHPDHQQARIILLLALTDQFDKGQPIQRPQEILGHLQGAYEKAYYAGIICERKGKAQLNHNSPGAGFAAYDLLREAMSWYEKAEAVRPTGNDDAALRWNACARAIANHHLQPAAEDHFRPLLE